MIEIRNYKETDRETVYKICLAKTTDSELMNKALLDTFCSYYIEHEPHHCYVAVDERGQVIGYVLCAVNFDKWERVFTEKYLKDCGNAILTEMGTSTINILRPFKHDYPAHLHIDILDGYRGQGVGTRLISTLKQSLQNDGIRGLCLDVASNNSSAIIFYLKNGFTALSATENETVMGIKFGDNND